VPCPLGTWDPTVGSVHLAVDGAGSRACGRAFCFAREIFGRKEAGVQANPLEIPSRACRSPLLSRQ